MDLFEKDRKGMVLRIERSSIYDGQGFRTVVFLKGCPLRCQWCSTPESQLFHQETTAENVYGTEMTVEEVMREIRKDSLFFFISTGGLTLSGGEILAQPEFTKAILRNTCCECMNTAIETSLYAPWETVEDILQYVHTAHVDVKMFDPALHKEYCGVDNKLILENLRKTNTIERNFRLVVRVPIIPGINDTEEELRNIAQFCAQLTHLEKVQLLPYHKLGTATYAKLGRPYLLKDVQTPSAEHMEWCRSIVGKYVKEVI